MDSKDDDYSIGDDPDFEIVSNANSVISSFGDSSPSTPHFYENEGYRHLLFSIFIRTMLYILLFDRLNHF